MNTHLNHTLPLATGQCIHERVAKLALYRECVALAMSVPGDQRLKQSTLTEVRTKWREHLGDGGQLLQLSLASCIDRICYGRMCITKQRLRKIPSASQTYDWAVQNPLENHQKYLTKRREEKASPDGVSMGSGRRDFVPMANWGAGNMDPDMVRRHRELTDRQHFMGPHWRNKPKPMVLEEHSFEEQLQIQFQAPPKIPKKIKKEF